MNRSVLQAFMISTLLSFGTNSYADPAVACKDLEFHLGTTKVGYLSCDRGQSGIEGEGDLYDVTDREKDPTAAATKIATIQAKLLPDSLHSMIELSFELTANKSYIVSLTRDIKLLKKVVENPLTLEVVEPPSLTEGWAPIYLPFTTKTSATITNTWEPLELGAELYLTSNTALRQCKDGQVPIVQEVISKGNFKPHAARIRKLSLNKQAEKDAKTETCEIALEPEPPSEGQFNPPKIGEAFLILKNDRFRQSSVRIDLSGVYDIFGQEVKIPADKQKVTLREIPKGKDDATYYLKLASEAAAETKPKWAVDTKLSPVLAGDFFGYSPTLNFLVDIGFAIENAANTVKLGGGLTRIFLTRKNSIQAIRSTVLLNYEADRDFDEKQNLVLEPDFRFYFPQLNHSRQLRSLRKYLEEIENKTEEEKSKIDPEDPRFRVLFGFSGQVWTGMEVGGSLVQPTVKTDDETSAIEVPRYGILRLRPKFLGTLEIGRFSIVGALTPRYIASTEKLAKQSKSVDPLNGKTIQLINLLLIDGWETYGELTLQYAIDESRHIDLSITYKRGSAPPKFSKVDTVQSGISIKY